MSETFAVSDLKTASTFATSLVRSKLNYCNTLYLNLPIKQIYRLQQLQNSVARAITGTPKTEHITPIFKSLHWLKIEKSTTRSYLLLTTHSTHKNTVIYVTSSTTNLTAPLAHLTILHYFVHTYLPFTIFKIFVEMCRTLSLTFRIGQSHM